MKLSVVIPVFQVEDYLDECLENLVKENEQEMEIILVDDASPDRCGRMCDNWSLRDKRIKVIHHKQNKGLSDARNTGIEAASGDYLAFIDSDDFVEPSTFQQLLAYLATNHEIDILEFPVVQKYGNKDKEHVLEFPERIYRNPLAYWFETQAYSHTYACNKIYKTNLFEQVRYPSGKKFEDVYTLPKLLRLHPVVGTTHIGRYYYRWNPEGITATADGNALNDLLSAHLNIIENLLQEYRELPTDTMGYYYHHVLNIQLDVYEQLGTSPKLPMLSYNQTLKLKLLHLLGINTLCKINRLYHRIRPSRW